jgi:hypothetical protein
MGVIFKKGPFDKKWTREDGQTETHVTKEDMDLEVRRLLNAGWYMNSWGTFTRTVVLFNRATRGYGQS